MDQKPRFFGMPKMRAMANNVEDRLGGFGGSKKSFVTADGVQYMLKTGDGRPRMFALNSVEETPVQQLLRIFQATPLSRTYNASSGDYEEVAYSSATGFSLTTGAGIDLSATDSALPELSPFAGNDKGCVDWFNKLNAADPKNPTVTFSRQRKSGSTIWNMNSRYYTQTRQEFEPGRHPIVCIDGVRVLQLGGSFNTTTNGAKTVIDCASTDGMWVETAAARDVTPEGAETKTWRCVAVVCSGYDTDLVSKKLHLIEQTDKGAESSGTFCWGWNLLAYRALRVGRLVINSSCTKILTMGAKSEGGAWGDWLKELSAADLSTLGETNEHRQYRDFQNWDVVADINTTPTGWIHEGDESTFCFDYDGDAVVKLRRYEHGYRKGGLNVAGSIRSSVTGVILPGGGDLCLYSRELVYDPATYTYTTAGERTWSLFVSGADLRHGAYLSIALTHPFAAQALLNESQLLTYTITPFIGRCPYENPSASRAGIGGDSASPTFDPAWMILQGHQNGEHFVYCPRVGKADQGSTDTWFLSKSGDVRKLDVATSTHNFSTQARLTEPIFFKK